MVEPNVWDAWIFGRTPESKSRKPWFESTLLPFRSLAIFVMSTTPHFTQMGNCVPEDSGGNVLVNSLRAHIHIHTKHMGPTLAHAHTRAYTRARAREKPHDRTRLLIPVYCCRSHDLESRFNDLDKDESGDLDPEELFQILKGECALKDISRCILLSMISTSTKMAKLIVTNFSTCGRIYSDDDGGCLDPTFISYIPKFNNYTLLSYWSMLHSKCCNATSSTVAQSWNSMPLFYFQ